MGGGAQHRRHKHMSDHALLSYVMSCVDAYCLLSRVETEVQTHLRSANAQRVGNCGASGIMICCASHHPPERRRARERDAIRKKGARFPNAIANR